MGSSPPIREDIKINDELKALEVIEFYKEGTVLTIEFSNKRLLQFEIDKSSIQKTYQNLEKAAEAIDFDAGILANAKYIFGKKYSQYFKLPEQQTQEQESKATEDSDVRQHNVFKYSTDIPLAEQIKLGEDYVFLQIINNKAVISPSIDLSKTKKIILYPRDKTPILDFEYESVEEINHLIEVAKSKTIDDIYFTSKAIWQKFVKATHEQIVLLTADSIFTFFQDSFVTTHYVMLVAHVGSGKGAILITFSYLGYRVVLAGNMSGGSILDLLGSLEMGQVVIAEDELNNLKSDSDKWNLYTLGYDAFGETTRTLDGSTTKRSINFYPAFSYKIFGAETSLDTSGLQGLIDRTFQTNLLKGKPDFYIKNLRKRRLSTDYTSLLSEIVSFRKLMLIYRLIHADHLFNEVKTNIDGRPLELTGPIIDLFHGLSEDKTSLNEIVPVLSSFLRQKGEIKEETFDNILFKIVKEICGYCRDKLHARSSKVDNIRYQHFIKTKIEELKSLYQVVTEIELLDGTLGRKYSVLGGKGENLTQTDTQQTTVETDILQQPTKDIVNISTIKQSETLQRPENEANNTAKTSLSLLKEDISVPPSRAYTGGVQQVLGTYVAFDLEWDATADNRIDAVSFVDSNGWSEAKLREHDYDGSEYQLLHHILLTLTKYQWSMGWNTQSNPQNAANLNTLDLRILYQRCEANGIESLVKIGNFGLPYLIGNELRHIDLLNVYSKVMVKEGMYHGDYRTNKLDHVSKALLGYGKYEGHSGADFASLSHEDQVQYSLRDSQLVMDLSKYNSFEVLDAMLAVAEITGLDFEKVCRTNLSTWWGAIFDKLIQEGKCPPIEKREFIGSYKGADVLAPKKGFYTNVVVVDAKSLYPSVGIKYNLSFETINCDCCQYKLNAKIEEIIPQKFAKDCKFVNPATDWICQKRVGAFPDRLKIFKAERLKQKDLGNKAKQHALKILINGGYGVFGNKEYSFYDPRVAELVTATGRYMLSQMQEVANDIYGFEIIYGDTDSLFLNSTNASPRALKEFQDRFKQEHDIELEIKNRYDKLLLSAGKKHYIGIENGKLDIVGYEAKKSDRPKFFNQLFMQVINCIERNSKHNNNAQVQIIKEWNNQRLPIKPLLGDFLAYLLDEKNKKSHKYINNNLLSRI